MAPDDVRVLQLSQLVDLLQDLRVCVLTTSHALFLESLLVHLLQREEIPLLVLAEVNLGKRALS